MKQITQYINEKYLIDIDTNNDIDINDDEWVLIDAPAWSNYDSSDIRKVRSTFPENRFFDIFGSMGIGMPMMLIKLSEIEVLQKMLGWRNKPRMFELPDQLSINATKKQITEFTQKHYRDYDKKWKYANLKKYQKNI